MALEDCVLTVIIKVIKRDDKEHFWHYFIEFALWEVKNDYEQ